MIPTIFQNKLGHNLYFILIYYHRERVNTTVLVILLLDQSLSKQLVYGKSYKF